MIHYLERILFQRVNLLCYGIGGTIESASGLTVNFLNIGVITEWLRENGIL